MAEVLLPVRPAEDTAFEPAARPVGPKAKARLARMIEERVAQGYRIGRDEVSRLSSDVRTVVSVLG